jgi:hypothetical protein
MKGRDIDRLDRLLAEGWRRPRGLVPGEDWKAGVMRDIASAAGEASAEANGFSRLLLRVSLGVAAASAALVAWTLSDGMAAYRVLAMKVLEEPASMIFPSPFI